VRKLNYINKLVENISKEIDLLLNEQFTKSEKKDVSKKITKLKTDVDDLKSKIQGLGYSSDFPYKRCEIYFDGEYELPIPEYGLEEEKRTLKGDMFFKVIGGDIDNKKIYLKTRSMENTFFKILIKGFKSFETLKLQKGTALLLYKDDERFFENNEVDIIFEFNKLK
jgi:hypothetical protein